MKKYLKKITFPLVAWGTFALTGLAQAADDDSPPWMKVIDFVRENNPIDESVAKTPVELLQLVITTITGFAGLVAVAVIVYGGYLYIVAAGNQENTKKAQQTIAQAVVGLVIILASWLVITTLIGILGQ